jgi:hypothetical protein
VPRTPPGPVLLMLAALVGCPLAAGAQSPVPTMGQEEEHLDRTPLLIQGFGDIGFIVKAPSGEPSGFSLGAFELFATSRLGDHFTVLAELVFESHSANTLGVDLERFQLTYEHSDALRISVGRMHSPLLRWPIIHHHGVFIQTPIDRPIMSRWEDEPGLWPMHFVGLIAQGRSRGSVSVNYAVGVGNGRGPVHTVVQVDSDTDSRRAVVASLGFSLDAVPGLAVHGSIYVDRIPAESGQLRERDYTVSTAYVRGAAEVRGEWSRMGHRSVSSQVEYDTTGWYVLAAHRLPGRFAPLKPFVLVEKLDAAEGEAFLNGAPDESNLAAGLRWDVNRWVALKADYRSRKLAGTDRSGAVRTQLAINF